MSNWRTNHRTGNRFLSRGWRSYTGFTHPSGTTALDIVNFEAKEHSNEDVRRQALSTGIDLSKIPARDVMWVTARKIDATHYGTPEQVNVKGWIVIAEDGDGGFLVVKPSVIVEPSEIYVGGAQFNYDDAVVGDRAIIYDFRADQEGFMGKGLGSLAYQALEDAYRKSGVKKIELEDVLEDAETFWRRMGFHYSDREQMWIKRLND